MGSLKSRMSKNQGQKNWNIYIDHVERKVPKYENHKLRERKEKTLTRNWRDHERDRHTQTQCIFFFLPSLQTIFFYIFSQIKYFYRNNPFLKNFAWPAKMKLVSFPPICAGSPFLYRGKLIKTACSNVLVVWNSGWKSVDLGRGP